MRADSYGGMSRPQLLAANKNGDIHNIPQTIATGSSGGVLFELKPGDLVKLPQGSQLFRLPERLAIGCNRFAVAAFTPPGYTVTYSAAYREIGRPKVLPLFSYAALAFYRGEFYAAAVKADRDLRHDSSLIDIDKVKRKVLELKKVLPKNRLTKHLEACALIYGCPGAQNFFLGRFEGPLPSSPFCNARCTGCISSQPDKRCPSTQPRIRFTPYPEEIAEVALVHIRNVKDTVVSFGQGCDGEPLLAGDVIEKAVKIIRTGTSKGIINMNTNASLPEVLAKLFDAGLDSIRVSLNSARKEYYIKYYKPMGYDFADVMRSIRIAKKKSKFVSINYLTMPGFTDCRDEFQAFRKLIATERVDMIQWRNMNYDPLQYFREMDFTPERSELLGVKKVMLLFKKSFPGLMMGYFNPSAQRLLRRRA